MTAPTSSNQAGKSEKLEAMLRGMWKSSHATILERIETLRVAQAALAAGSLDDAARKNAESAAHKLAGILGTFGLPQGTQLASQIEALLASPSPLSVDQTRDFALWLDQLESVIASKAV